MSLPFIVGPLYMIAATVLVVLLLATGKLSDKIAMLVLGSSVIVAGLLQGGILDTVIYLHEVLYYAINGLAVNRQQALKVALLLVSFLAVGRLFCGYVCPLGAVQELISRFFKKQVHIRTDIAEKVRLTFLAAFILLGILLPSLYHFNPFWLVSPALGMFKLAALIAIAAMAIFIYRPWCTLVCPFGALGSLLSRVSILRLKVSERCTGCGACTKKCPTQQPPYGTMSECYYCGRCVKACPRGAIRLGTASTLSIRMRHRDLGPSKRDV